ncbi:NAD-dependent epimerase/dehydratase family protein [Psychrosphaera sp.]|nr:NAD-dependent epimerase/dehydratase family protein [Psychrosphaera sp.]
MKAFVTGGTGFLGINLIRQLDALGWNITAICRPDSNTSSLDGVSVDWRTGLITNKEDIEVCMDNDIDVIFHIAGDTNLWTPNNTKQHELNVTATQYVVDAALKRNVKRFIHTSSISAYGFHSDVINESSESLAMASNVNYLKTKYLGEQVVKQAVAEHNLPAVILNPCAIMGRFDKHNWSQLFTMINEDALPGVPSGEGSYCHVDEVAKAHIAAVTEGQIGDNYILAGVDHRFLDVVNRISVLLNKPKQDSTIAPWLLKLVGRLSYWASLVTRKEPNMTPEKALMVTKRVVAASDKAVAELGYNNNVQLDVMLKETYEWLKSENRL